MATASSVGLRNGSAAIRWYLLAFAVVLLDQYTKGLASGALDYGRPVEIFFWFDLTLHHNTGAAFSFLSDAGGWQRWFFVTIALLISVALVFWMRQLQAGERLTAYGLALIVGGAIGNLIDRVWLGKVIDFLQWHWQEWYWPAFNLADSAITLGVILLLLDGLVSRRSAQEPGP